MFHQQKAGRKSLWRIGEIMLQKEWINWRQLAAALNTQNIQKILLGEILVQQNNELTPKHVLKALAIQYGLEFIDLKQLEIIDGEALLAVPRACAEHYTIFPLEISKKRLKVAMPSPLNHFVKAVLSDSSGISDIDVVLASPEEIQEAIRRYYPPLSLAA